MSSDTDGAGCGCGCFIVYLGILAIIGLVVAKVVHTVYLYLFS